MPRASQPKSFDGTCMALALRMAKRGLGRTAPNPSVGAVIADEATCEILAVGWTQPGGRPHAEAQALRMARENLGAEGVRGKTMYVTLEPCAHTGRTPTCADQILTSGVSRLVCAIPDPNPIVAGHGFGQLREAGIEVDVGLLADEARYVTLGHILRQTAGRPFVTVKLAVSADGRFRAGDGAPVWVTGLEARAAGHMLRAEHDAILVGIKTILADNPRLDCRLPGMAERSPQRIVIDNKLRTPIGAAVLGGGGKPTLIFATVPDTTAEAKALAAKGAIVLGNMASAMHWKTARNNTEMGANVDLARVLSELAKRGITRVLVEGGPTIAANVLDADLADAVTVFSSSERLGEAGIPALGVAGLAHFSNPQWALAETRALGTDLLRRFVRQR